MATRKNSRTPQQNEAISDKVDDLLAEGYPVHQATAIAFRMFRDGELTIPRMTSRQYRILRTRRGVNLLQQIADASALLGLGKFLTNKNKPK